DGSPLEWAKKGRWDRLRLAAVRASADSFDLGGLEFHSSVAQGRKLMPCATTPAPTDDGRAKPRSTRGRTPRDADARWLEGGRQFAPWHYTVEAMLQDSKGVLHIPPPEVKEQLHHIPTGYTANTGADAKTRRRMVGNGWHWGVASRLLGLLVMATWAKPVASGASPAPEPPEPQVLGEGLDEDRHWAAAARMKHSLVGWPTLEPALEAILEFRREWRHDLVRIRRDVLRELQEMVEDGADDSDAWLATLPDHVRATYVTEDRPRPFQGLVLDRLLRGVGYPAADDLQQDVNAGFDMLGPVRPAP
ncbi:PUB3, partial [Symbiodinium necroappetens]